MKNKRELIGGNEVKRIIEYDPEDVHLDCYREVEFLNKKIDRLREALEVYADKRHWRHSDINSVCEYLFYYGHYQVNGWEPAQKALKELK